MSNKIPYAPPPTADEVDEDSEFEDLPADVALDFNDRGRAEYAPEGDDDEADLWDEESEFEDPEEF